MVPPDFPISHQCSQLCRISSTGVSAQGVDIVGLGSASSSVSVGWLPKHQLLSAQLRVPEAVSRKPKAPHCDFVTERMELSIESLVCSVTAPVDVGCFA